MAILACIAKQLNLPVPQVEAVLHRAPLRYKVYKIPKRTYGLRTIAQPSRQLKTIQRAFLACCPLPVHETAIAYRQGLSIKDNAQRHAHNSYLLKLDLNNFFNSITPAIFWQAWDSYFDRQVENTKLLESLLFWAPQRVLGGRLVLSVGAPSSPSVSNFVMHRFDAQLSQYCKQQNIVYTRYADDLTFSTSERDVLFLMPDQVASFLNTFFNGEISINKRKTVFSSKAHNRHVTGIRITNQGKLSLGRARKRYIKHLVHQFCLDSLSSQQLSHLQGWLAYASHIEPQFLEALAAKYGKATIKQIQR